MATTSIIDIDCLHTAIEESAVPFQLEQQKLKIDIISSLFRSFDSFMRCCRKLIEKFKSNVFIIHRNRLNPL